MHRVFIGFDQRETWAYHVLCHSIISQSSVPVSITPLILDQLDMSRPKHPLQSTDFAFSRFLTPYLSGYEGWSVFMDCDMLFRADIDELFSLADDRYAVMVCKHEHEPEEEVKFLGAKQTKYEKKNWSSLMLFNNEKCRALTPEYVDTATGLQLHQFKWCKDKDVGSLPLEWNHLVGYYDKDKNAKNVHFTIGGPYFTKYQWCDYSDEWRKMDEQMCYVDLMSHGRSILDAKSRHQASGQDREDTQEVCAPTKH